MTFTGTQPSATDMDPSDDQSHEVLAGLREEFPCFRIWRERTCDRIRYVARSLHPGLNPHTVVTDDLDELRAALEPSRHAACARPQAARHIRADPRWPPPPPPRRRGILGWGLGAGPRRQGGSTNSKGDNPPEELERKGGTCPGQEHSRPVSASSPCAGSRDGNRCTGEEQASPKPLANCLQSWFVPMRRLGQGSPKRA